MNHDESISDKFAALESQYSTETPQSGREVGLGHGDKSEQAPECGR